MGKNHWRAVRVGELGAGPAAGGPHWRSLQEAEASSRRPRLRPLTRNQGVYFHAVETSTVTFCTGPAGTGKTYMACGLAAEMLKAGRVGRIVLSRPLLECDEKMGYLPGGPGDKTAPFMVPLLDAFGDFFDAAELTKLSKCGLLEVCPLAHMRGRTLRNAFCVLDEAQNATLRQLKMFLTRFGGPNPRVVVCGDASQSDLPHRGPNPLLHVIDRLFDVDDVAVVYLGREDIVRHGLIQQIVERLGE